MGRSVILKHYLNLNDAELAQQFLLDQSIQTTLQVDQIEGGVNLWIDELDLEKGQDILQLFR